MKELPKFHDKVVNLHLLHKTVKNLGGFHLVRYIPLNMFWLLSQSMTLYELAFSCGVLTQLVILLG